MDRDNGYLTEEETKQYAEWLINESGKCAISEVEWLVSKVRADTCNEIRDNVLKFLEENR